MVHLFTARALAIPIGLSIVRSIDSLYHVDLVSLSIESYIGPGHLHITLALEFPYYRPGVSTTNITNTGNKPRYVPFTLPTETDKESRIYKSESIYNVGRSKVKINPKCYGPTVILSHWKYLQQELYNYFRNINDIPTC